MHTEGSSTGHRKRIYDQILGEYVEMGRSSVSMIGWMSRCPRLRGPEATTEGDGELSKRLERRLTGESTVTNVGSSL